MGWIASGGTSLTVAESDGTPSVSGVSTILVSNTTLTDNTGGSVTIAMTPAGGANTALSNLASVAINASLVPGADGSLNLGTAALRFGTVFGGTAFSIYKAASEANPTATLGNGVLNFGAGTSNAVDVGLKRSSGGVLYVTDGSSGAGDLNAHGLVIADTTMVTNLNADTVDGSHAAAFANVALSNLASAAINAPLVTGVGTALTLEAAAPITDAAPSVSLLKGADAFPGAATNTTGANTILAGGIGKRIFTVVDYTGLALSTVTVTVNGTATVKTEGTDWFDETSNNATATSLATAIDGIAGVSATASSAVVRIVPDVGTYSLTIAKTAADAGMTATSGTNGAVGSQDQLTILNAGGNIILDTNGATGFRIRNAANDGYASSVSMGTAYVWGGNNINLINDASVVALGGSLGVGITYSAPGVMAVCNGASSNSLGSIVASTAITAVGTAAYNGVIRTGVYKRAWTNAEVVALGAVDDAELKIATLPAKTIVRNAYIVVDTRETHLTDLTVALGRTGATYIDYIVASDADVSAESLGSELVTNGTFTTNPNGWTLGGGGGTPDWYYNTNKVSHASDSAEAALSQSIAVTAGTQYKVQVTISGYTGGSLTVTFYEDPLDPAISGDGTFTYYVTAEISTSTPIAFTPSVDFVGNVDDVTIKVVARTVYGDAVGERGTNLTGYDLPSYTTTTDVYLNFVTTDVGHDLTNALQSTGTVYLMTETLP